MYACSSQLLPMSLKCTFWAWKRIFSLSNGAVDVLAQQVETPKNRAQFSSKLLPKTWQWRKLLISPLFRTKDCSKQVWLSADLDDSWVCNKRLIQLRKRGNQTRVIIYCSSFNKSFLQQPAILERFLFTLFIGSENYMSRQN